MPESKPKVTYAHCQIFTNLPGMSCPLCGTTLTPNVGHACSKPEADKPPVVKRVRRKNAGK